MKWNRATVVLSVVFLLGLAFFVGLKNRVLASPQAPAKKTQSKSPAKKAQSKDPSVVGQWGVPISLGIVPIHAALLPNSQGAFLGISGNRRRLGNRGELFNPATNALTALTTTGLADFFCSGATHLSNGEVLIDGGLVGPIHHGDNGSPNVVIFNPTTSIFTQEPSMSYSRYYPTNITMPDGTQLVVSGQDATGEDCEPVGELESHHE